jgi:hypothetical protein
VSYLVAAKQCRDPLAGLVVDEVAGAMRYGTHWRCGPRRCVARAVPLVALRGPSGGCRAKARGGWHCLWGFVLKLPGFAWQEIAACVRVAVLRCAATGIA